MLDAPRDRTRYGPPGGRRAGPTDRAAPSGPLAGNRNSLRRTTVLRTPPASVPGRGAVPHAGAVSGHGPAAGEGLDRLLLLALRDCGADPRVAALARGLSLGGEHAALWLVAGLGAAVADGARRDAWLRGTALTAAAHLTGMAVKRLVRRPRPVWAGPLVRTAGRHSFPSAHAVSAAAAVTACGTVRPGGGGLARAVPPLAAAICVSRLVLGVHYPSDVAAGVLLGGLLGRLGSRWVAGAWHHAAAPVTPVRTEGRRHV